MITSVLNLKTINELNLVSAPILAKNTAYMNQQEWLHVRMLI